MIQRTLRQAICKGVRLVPTYILRDYHPEPARNTTRSNCPSTLQGYLAHKKQPPPSDHCKTLGIVLMWGPRRGRGVLMKEVPLCVAFLQGQLISHNVFIMSFCKSQFPHKSVNLLFVLVIVKDELMDLWGS